MDNKEQQERLERYIFRLMQLKESQLSAFTAKTTQQVADELGLTEEDIAFFAKVARDHQERAVTYASVGHWEEARLQWQAAAELLPFDPAPAMGLAELSFKEWKDTGAAEAKLACEKHLREVLQLSPQNEQAKELLQMLSKRARFVLKKRRFMKIGYGLGVLLLCVVAVFVIALAGLFGPYPTGFEDMVYEVPVTVAASPELEGMEIESSALRIEHSAYDGSALFDFYYTGRVRFPAHDLRAQRLGLAFLDSSGQEVAAHYLWVTGSIYDKGEDVGPHRVPAGAWVYMNTEEGWMPEFKEGKPVRIARAELRHDVLDKLSVPATRFEREDLAIAWVARKPEQLQLSGKLEYWAVEEEETVAIGHLAFTLANDGELPIRELLAELVWLDEQGLEVRQDELLLVSSKNLPLQGGERLFFSTREYFHEESYPEGMKLYNYRLSIKLVN